MFRQLFQGLLFAPTLGFVVPQDSKPVEDPLFEAVTSGQTGITFANQLPETPDLNIITYEYFYNGGGVGAGDFNNDGLVDLYFSANTHPGRLYLNRGNFQFEDITDKAGLHHFSGWTTGVSLADVNGDGWLDIYLCRSGNHPPEKRRNLLFLNNGNLTFTEKAASLGLADAGYSTMASFFDMDRDGDLDAYVLNHNVKQFRNFDAAYVKNQIDPDAGDHLYENRSGIFHDITREAGIRSNPLGYGLGLNISDINSDGWPDIYVSNDYVEEDYLYLNKQDGSFREVLKEQLPHISNFSMGLDIADINNDGLQDIFTLDMLPRDNERQKLLYAPDNFELYNNMVENGFHHQLMRNMLHLNNGNGTFSEIGQLAGIADTDWSWAALFADFNNDGAKDLFVTNGYGRDMINRDFMKFYANARLKHLQGDTDSKMFSMLQSIRSTPLQNYLFENQGNLHFKDQTIAWGLGGADFAHGAAYADLDNDGDLDLVFNRMNAQAGIYRNRSVETGKTGNYLRFYLSSHTANTQALGTSIKVFTPDGIRIFEKQSVHGFQSSMVLPVHAGLPDLTPDSIHVTWPDGKMTRLTEDIRRRQTITLHHQDAQVPFLKEAPPQATLFRPVPDTLRYLHREMMVNDFKVQPLIPNMVSYHGPESAIGDINGDGLDDLYLCGPEGQPGALFLQNRSGKFIPSQQPLLAADAAYEDAYAEFFDADGDNDLDLYVVSGGYGAPDSGLPLQDRLYFNRGGLFSPADQGTLPNLAFSGSVAVPWDYDKDGDLDVFVGARVEQGRYPYAPESVLLANDGKGSFTVAWKQPLGMVTHALLLDVDGDGNQELAVCGEWSSLLFFAYREGSLRDISSSVFPKPLYGWWNTLHAADLDGDGDTDLIGGNWGTNSSIRVSEKEPMELFYDDFDRNGYPDPILCAYIEGVSYPFPTRDEMTDQMVGLRKKFVTYDSYARMTLPGILSPEEVQASPRLQVNTLETLWFENQEGIFQPRSLPVEVNFAPIHAVLSGDFDNDGVCDVLLAGNAEQTRIRIGRSDANYGCLLKGMGSKRVFTCVPPLASGLAIQGAVRSLKKIEGTGGKWQIIAGVNNRAALLLIPQHQRP